MTLVENKKKRIHSLPGRGIPARRPYKGANTLIDIYAIRAKKKSKDASDRLADVKRASLCDATRRCRYIASSQRYNFKAPSAVRAVRFRYAPLICM